MTAPRIAPKSVPTMPAMATTSTPGTTAAAACTHSGRAVMPHVSQRSAHRLGGSALARDGASGVDRERQVDEVAGGSGLLVDHPPPSTCFPVGQSRAHTITLV